MRLHLNENTAGCSPRVLAALEALTGEDIAFYPDYGDVERETAAFLGVPRNQLVLTNGLDEGIFVAIVAAARETVAGDSAIRPEVIVPLPAFDMYGVTARAVGAQVVEVPPQEGFRLPVASLLAAVTGVLPEVVDNTVADRRGLHAFPRKLWRERPGDYS